MGVYSGNAYSGFLTLPVELRCQIYEYLDAEPRAITISAGKITNSSDITHGSRRTPKIPGVPLDLTPLVQCQHNPDLLAIAYRRPISNEDLCKNYIDDKWLVYPATMSLLLTCRLIHDEIIDFMRWQKKIAQAQSASENTHSQNMAKEGNKGKQEREEKRMDKDENVEDNMKGLSLYVTYPYGVLVLKHMYPLLLKQARRVHISGHYRYTAALDAEAQSANISTSIEVEIDDRLTPSNSFATAESFGRPAPTCTDNSSCSNSRRTLKRPAATQEQRPNTRPRLRLDSPLASDTQENRTMELSYPLFTPSAASLAPPALSLLVRTLLPNTSTNLSTLTARIIYPGENSYAPLWSDEESPVSIILRNICGGKINMQVMQTNLATGIHLTAQPKPEGRIVSTSWKTWGRISHRPQRYQRPNTMCLKDLDKFLQGGS
ncbi:hypothetical protein ACN47E_003263 [Coniothyrium glycines]